MGFIEAGRLERPKKPEKPEVSASSILAQLDLPPILDQAQTPQGGDDLITDILSTRMEIARDEIGDIKFGLEYGSKALTITYDLEGNSFGTLIRNLNFRKKERVSGETTALYTAAKIIMQAVAKARGQAVEYSFETVYDNMREWAQGAGNDIFHWQEERVKNGEYSPNGYYIAQTMVSPEDRPEHELQ